MFKLLFYLNILLIFITLNAGKSFKRGHVNENSLNTDEPSWQNMWFPHPTNYHNDVNTQAVNVTTLKSGEEYLSNTNKDSEWAGLWFPHLPNYQSNKTVEHINVKYKDSNELECDNGKNGISLDFDPQDKRHSFNYLCISNKHDYAPNLNTSALLNEYSIPMAYEPSAKCLNETIEYVESIPTFGSYRPLAPKFGTYQYLPPQRWMHSLIDGAIVLLYHPCAFPGEVDKLKNILKGCLYRYIITPYQFLTPQRPLTLLTWGKSLQMSVVDDAIVVKFIKNNAKMGFNGKKRKLITSSKLYNAGLLTEAHLVTDEQDNEICGYKEIR